MTWDGAWNLAAVDTPIEVGRLLAYVATGGASGVVGVGDCQVRELDTPGGSVRAMPGAVIVKSGYPSAGQQSYAARNPDEDVVPVTATGSSAGRSDLVVARVKDTQYPGYTTDGPETFIVEDVAAGTLTVADAISQGKTGLDAATELARIDIPASTATITQAMITDLRKMVAPRTANYQNVLNQANGATVEELTATTFTDWPSFAIVSVDIPPWAVRAQILAMLTCRADGNAATTAQGDLRTVFAGDAAPSTYFNFTIGGTQERATIVAGRDQYLPVSVRGTSQTLKLQAQDGNGGANLKSDGGTTVAWLLTFYESPDEQFWS